MNKTERIKELKAELETLESELGILEEDIAKQDIFKQEGVLYWVWDNEDNKHKIIKRLHSFGESDTIRGLNGSDDSYCIWINSEIVYPQWIDIPDSLMESPDIKGEFIIEGKNGGRVLKHTDDCYWDFPLDSTGRIKRVCILEAQS